VRAEAGKEEADLRKEGRREEGMKGRKMLAQQKKKTREQVFFLIFSSFFLLQHQFRDLVKI